MVIGKEAEFEVSLLKKAISREYIQLKKSSIAPHVAVIHLEKICDMYDRVHKIEGLKPGDRAGWLMLKLQYKALCTIAGQKAKAYD